MGSERICIALSNSTNNCDNKHSQWPHDGTKYLVSILPDGNTETRPRGTGVQCCLLSCQHTVAMLGLARLPALPWLFLEMSQDRRDPSTRGRSGSKQRPEERVSGGTADKL